MLKLWYTLCLLFGSSNGLWQGSIIRGIAPDPFKGANITEPCKSDCQYYFDQLNKPWSLPFLPFNKWYFQMMDSTGKIRDGLFAGNFKLSGNQRQCMAVSVDENEGLFNKKHHKFKGAFHWVTNGVWSAGICAPSTCTQEDVGQMYTNIKRQTSLVDNRSTYQSYQMWTADRTKAKRELDYTDRAFIIFLTVWGVLLVLGTLLEYWMYLTNIKSPPQYWQKFLLGFGVYRNVCALTRIDHGSQEGGKERLSCLDGIRFMSISWVVLCHTVQVTLTEGNTQNILRFVQVYVKPVSFNIILNAFVSVDTFFTLSGCLVSYLALKEMEKTKGRLNVLLFYLHRYLRLSGVYFFLVFYHATLFDKFFPNTQSGDAYACRKYYWTNLGYVNNFWHVGPVPGDDPCMGVTWYMANDMQMFILSPLIFMPLFFFKIPGLIWSGFVIMAATLTPIITTAVYKWPVSAILASGDPELSAEWSRWNYSVPWQRFAPYMWGLLLGYFLHVTKKPGSFKIPGPSAILLWLVAFAVGMSIVLGLDTSGIFASGPNKPPESPSLAASALYNGLSRSMWGLAVSWVIFACCRGYGGWINDFLSWEAWQPLSKISFIVYLIHYDFLQIFNEKGNQWDFGQDLTPFLLAIDYLGVMSFAVLFAGAIFVLIEVPWLNTEKLFMGTLQGLFAPAKKKDKAQSPNIVKQTVPDDPSMKTESTNLDKHDDPSMPKKPEHKV